MEPIFNSVVKKETINDDLVSFKDCPNKCVKGYMFDPYKHTKVLCSYCADKRKSLLSSNSVLSNNVNTLDLLGTLNLDISLKGIEFNINDIIPVGFRANIEPATYEIVSKNANDLLNKAALGELPNHSMLFNFGLTCNVMSFAYPLLIRYYLAGRTVAPFLTGLDLCRLRYLCEINSKEQHLGISYNDLLDRDICLVYLDSGCTDISFYAAKGLLSLRALKQKVTIFVANNYNVLLGQIETPNYMENCKHLATPYFVKYIEGSFDRNVVQNNVEQSSKLTEPKSEFDRLLGK